MLLALNALGAPAEHTWPTQEAGADLLVESSPPCSRHTDAAFPRRCRVIMSALPAWSLNLSVPGGCRIEMQTWPMKQELARV